ncbi:hypothetical protein D0T85_00190 [Bacteroides sp. 519]|nr:hypothetical protein [Bacteroides sp. 519]
MPGAELACCCRIVAERAHKVTNYLRQNVHGLFFLLIVPRIAAGHLQSGHPANFGQTVPPSFRFTVPLAFFRKGGTV